jgi:hypothetical protein
MTIDLTDGEVVALLRELNNIIENDRYPLSPRIRTLREIRANSPAPAAAPPPRPPRTGRPRRYSMQIFGTSLPRWCQTTRREPAHVAPGKSQSSASEQQIEDEHDQQNTADTDASTIPPPAIAETATEEEHQYYNNQDQVHLFPRCGFPKGCQEINAQFGG